MNSGGEQVGSSVPDEEWERFLRESEEGVRDAPKEPSARARMVTRRLQEQDAGQQQPQGWRTYAPARQRKRVWYVVGLLACVALVLVALDPGRVTGWFGGGGADAPPLATETERPTEAPAAEAAQQGTLDEPFRGSPATRWADGAAGIGVPAARATGWMSKAQVAQALRRTRDFLVASSLDPKVLRGERPAEAIAFINPHQPKERTFLDTSLSTPSEKNNPLVLFSRFDTARARLVGDVVKTRGRLTFEEGEHGALKVSTDVTYVYPVVRAESGSDQVVRTIVRREVVVNWDDPAKIKTEAGTFSVVRTGLDTTNAGCDTYTGFLVPTFDAARQGGGPTVDPYDRSTAIRDGEGQECGTATRS
ncbi:hypothetical protein ACIREE_15325 [Streptomyces sp. NPDC102467]|uniref:hypothetical protein n=1 Tax=Streptomyces sp. NPDC102467 TaxID=3366179 RepID=UPI003811F556